VISYYQWYMTGYTYVYIRSEYCLRASTLYYVVILRVSDLHVSDHSDLFRLLLTWHWQEIP